MRETSDIFTFDWAQHHSIPTLVKPEIGMQFCVGKRKDASSQLIQLYLDQLSSDASRRSPETSVLPARAHGYYQQKNWSILITQR